MAVAGLAVTTVALFFMSQMGIATTQTDLIIRMIATGIGLGVSFPIFNLVVQNAVDHSMLGVATASIQMFRSIGATVGGAILGSVLNNALASKLSNLSSDPFVQNMSRSNPQFNLNNIDANKLQGLLSGEGQHMIEAKLSLLPATIQPQAIAAFHEFITKIRGAFASSVTEVFLISAIVTAIAFLASFFLKEIPLRTSHGSPVEKAGKELAVEEGEFPAKSEPDIR
jgi:hypothetical protein